MDYHHNLCVKIQRIFFIFFHFYFSQTDTNEAVSCLLKAVDIYTDMGRFTVAAKHHQNIAEIYENEANDLVRFQTLYFFYILVQ